MKVEGKVVILPKIGRVAMVEELRFNGSIREVTINRTARTWFACFCIEDGEEMPSVKAGPTVGVDVGVGTMATCSDGTSDREPEAADLGDCNSCGVWTRPSPAAGTSTAKAIIPTGRERLYTRRRQLARPGGQRSQ